MNFIDFNHWFSEIYDNDYEYMKYFKYYGFRFTFYKESLYWEKKEIFPNYPWKNEFKELYLPKYKITNDKNNKIKNLKIQNLKLKLLLKKLQSRYIRRFR
jgi:hypothetical protein